MKANTIFCGLLALTGLTNFSLAAEQEPFAIVARDGEALCLIVTGEEPAFMEERAAQEIARVILRDSGVQAEVKRWEELGSSPSGNIVLLGTPDSVPLIGELTQELPEGLGDLPLIGPDGYVVQTLKRDGTSFLIIAGATPRAVYYGAVYAGEQVIETQRAVGASPAHGGAGPNAALEQERPRQQSAERLVVREHNVTRVPAMTERAPYTLGFTGIQPEYTVDDWKVILDGMARESINRVYFWWQSLYKPRDFPDRRNIDGGTERVKMSNDDVNELARYAHQLGMEFLLGGGAFSWGGAAALTDVYPETAAKGAGGMCPSHPKARELQLKFSLEMLDVIPEADGIWFEPRDEHGECKCEVCQKPVDEYGSKQYGQSEITWLKSFAKALWAKRPDGRIAWLIELYKPSKMHSEDPAYFEEIGKIKDPRIHWIVVWGAWEFPGPRGEYRPISFFSRNHIWWNKPYIMTLENMRSEVLRTRDMGLLGFSPAFEMCFSVDYHGAAIPYPMDQLPYELTSYAFREFSWEPSQTMDEFKVRMQRRYFRPGASMQLVEDLIYLRQFAATGGWASNRSTLLTKMAGEFIFYNGKPLPKQDPATVLAAVKGYNESDRKIVLDRLERELKEVGQILTEDMPKFAAIEARLGELEPQATRREKHSIELMRRFIARTRELLDKIGLDEAKIEAALEAVESTRSMAVAPSSAVPSAGAPSAAAPATDHIPEGAKVIRPAAEQDGHVLLSAGSVAVDTGHNLWGKLDGKGCVAVGIHSLPADLTASRIFKARLLIPQTEVPWSEDTSAKDLQMNLVHIQAADPARVTIADGSSAPVGQIGAYRAPGPLATRYDRHVEFDVTALINADLGAGRRAFAWRIEPASVGDSANSQLYIPSAENKDPVFPENNRGARLILQFEQ